MNKPVTPQSIEADQFRRVGELSVVTALAKSKTVEEANAILKGQRNGRA